MTTLTAAPGIWVDAWSDALSDLELDLVLAERQLAAAHASAELTHVPRPWQPPVGLGPLPASLQQRAQALLDRQVEVGRRLAEAANMSRRQAIAAEGLRSRPPAVPVYLDIQV